MPNAKRLKGSGAAKARRPKEVGPQADDGRPTPAEVEEEEHEFVQLARKHWLKSGKRVVKPKVKNDVLKQSIWDVLEKEGFHSKSLLLLESLQALEKCASSTSPSSVATANPTASAISGLPTLATRPTTMSS